MDNGWKSRKDENEKITHFNGNKTRLIEINRRLDLDAPRIYTSERPDRKITQLEVFIL